MDNQNDTSMSVAGMVLGIVSIAIVLSAGFVSAFWFSLLLSLIGVILSGMGMKRNPAGKPGHGMAVAGLTMNIIVLAAGITIFLAFGAIGILSLNIAMM